MNAEKRWDRLEKPGNLMMVIEELEATAHRNILNASDARSAGRLNLAEYFENVAKKYEKAAEILRGN